MVIADLDIICLNQKHKCNGKFSKIGVDCLKNSTVSKLYGNKWSVLNALKGYLYYLYPIDDCKQYDYNCGFFDLLMNNNEPHVILNSLDINEISEIIQFYLDNSPINKICLLIRLDWNNENNIVGTYSKNDFLKKLKDKEVLFNTAYIIEQ